MNIRDLSDEDIFCLLLREGFVKEEQHDTTFFCEVYTNTAKRPALPNTRYVLVHQITSGDLTIPEEPIEVDHFILTMSVDENDTLRVESFEPRVSKDEIWYKKYGIET